MGVGKSTKTVVENNLANPIKNHVKHRIGYYQLWQLDTRLLQEFINKIYIVKIHKVEEQYLQILNI